MENVFPMTQSVALLRFLHRRCGEVTTPCMSPQKAAHTHSLSFFLSFSSPWISSVLARHIIIAIAIIIIVIIITGIRILSCSLWWWVGDDALAHQMPLPSGLG